LEKQGIEIIQKLARVWLALSSGRSSSSAGILPQWAPPVNNSNCPGALSHRRILRFFARPDRRF